MARKKKEKRDKILMLAESKVNSIETLTSQALNDLDTSHEEFIMILNEKDRYEKMKYNLISENGDGKQEIVEISSIILKKIDHIKKFYFLFFLYIRAKFKHV